MNVLVRGVRLLLKLAHTDPVASKLDLKPRGINASSPWWPGVADPDKVCLDVYWHYYSGALPDVRRLRSQITDHEIQEMLRRTALPAWHPVRSFLLFAPSISLSHSQLHLHMILLLTDNRHNTA